MSDSVEAPELEALDTPVEESTATPDEGHGDTETTNWEKRYADLQPAYTKASQEAAELRAQLDRLKSDPDAQREFLTELGYEFAEDDTDTEPALEDEGELDEITALQQRLEQLEKARAAEQEAAHIKRIDNFIDTTLSEIGEQRGTPLTDAEKEFVISTALSSLPAGENNMPQIKAAYEKLEQLLDSQKKQWIESKKAPAAPTGVAASEVPDLDNEQERQKYMLARLAAKRDI